jgi:protein-S-isoprenylcysteine O-methyltransferase Ste14
VTFSGPPATQVRENNLARHTIVGFVLLAVILGVALFGSAGTLDFWQAWVYLLVFMGSSALITVYLWRESPELLARRVNAGPTAEKQTSQQVIQLVASVAFIGCLVVPALDHRFGWSNLPLYFVILGDILVAAGFLIVLRVFQENAFTAATIEVAADQKVISTGPYAVVRHPMYAGALVLLFGTALALGSSWGSVPFGVMTLTIAARLLDEERFLANNLPGYTDYCQRVRYRLIPFVW